MKPAHISGATSRGARAFTLIELIFALVLLGAFALISTKLLVASLKIPHDAGQQHDEIIRFEQIVSRLRKDVWSAEGLASPDEHTAVIDAGNGQKITWNWDSEQLKRTAADPQKPQTWPLPEQLHFAANGPTLTIGIVQNAGHHDQIEMISQSMLARREAGK